MKKIVPIVFLCSWLPLIMAIAIEVEAPGAADVFYTISGLMMMIFGTWVSILMLAEDK